MHTHGPAFLVPHDQIMVCRFYGCGVLQQCPTCHLPLLVWGLLARPPPRGVGGLLLLCGTTSTSGYYR